MEKGLRKFNKYLSLFVGAMLLIFQFGALNITKASELIGEEVSIRVEAPDKTIIEGTETGTTAYEVLEKVLKKNNISLEAEDSQYGKFIKGISGVTSGKFGGYDGWLYYIKNGTKVETAGVSIDSYKLNKGDNIVVYYGNFDTPYINTIDFNKEVIKENEPFEMIFSFKSFDYTSNKDIVYPIKDAKVIIDDKEYITNAEGKIVVEALKKGEHQYSISGYEKDKLPIVIKDRGKFVIDNVNKPLIYFNDDNSIKKEEVKKPKDIKDQLELTLNYIKNNSSNSWAALSLDKYGIKSDESYLKTWVEEIEKDGLTELNAIDIESKIMALTALGYSSYDFAGHNLVEELYNRNLNDFYNNEVAFGLLAYNYLGLKDEYKIGEKELIESLLNLKLSYKSEDKNLVGWTWYGDKIDPDMTAVVISALSPYYRGREIEGVDNKKVKDSVDEAVKTLALLQNENGDILGQYGSSSETNSFAIIALTSLGINPEGEMFTKEKGDLVSALLSYSGDNGQFNHDDKSKNNYISTEEALRALISLDEFSKNGIYDYYKGSKDIKNLPSFKIKESEEDKNGEIKKTEEIVNDNAVQDNKNANKSSVDVLPKTGSLINFYSMIIVSFAFIISGIKKIK
ncbi:DUF4430 domain-containing protein [Clostridium algidicarnis]|uniref:DUF4430 domain-containing protein n=1 Tax=Clostridium algidicarnis TaxID=37659 RepID=UPI00162A3C1D|nr:DUF4430 domain-containing protein [Clostridium algidicarnis]MBB6697975.1 DUF4430 domain-containing protein [Clostridium algidicarnis]